MNLKRFFAHPLLISIPILLIGFNTAFQVPARSLHVLHAHHHDFHTGAQTVHACGCPLHIEADETCPICEAFDLLHTVFFSKFPYFPGYFTGITGPVPCFIPAFIEDFYLFCFARAPPA